jgi:hypothetical protein
MPNAWSTSLFPANHKQRRAIEVAKRMIWWSQGRQQADVLRARFDRAFRCSSTGYSDGFSPKDALLARLRALSFLAVRPVPRVEKGPRGASRTGSNGCRACLARCLVDAPLPGHCRRSNF